jgi:hypothetical protein
MLHATLNEAIPLQLVADNGRIDLYARATIYKNNLLVTTLDLAHVAQGFYSASYIPTSEGYYSIIYKFYEDNAYSVEAPFSLEGELLEVNSDKINLLRILGLLHENSVVDQTVYDANGNLLTARVRAYDSKANALVAGVTGLRFTWSVTAQYNAQNRMLLYRIAIEP